MKAVYGIGPAQKTALVRLVNQNGSAVSGSTMMFTYADAGVGAVSGPLTLSEGSRYRLQVKDGTPTGWEVLNADMWLIQSTTDPYGLGSMVSWYAATAVPTVLVDGQRTEHLILPPVNDAELSRIDWITVGKRTDGSGDVQADLVNSAGATLVSGGSVSSNSYTLQTRRLSAPSLGGEWWDTKAVLGAGTAGKLAGSVVRASLRLRGTIIALDADNPAFSPNGDGVKDSTLITGEIHPDAEDPVWQLAIRDDANVEVMHFTGTGRSVTVPWDGTNTDGVISSDGPYTVTLSLPMGSSAFRQIVLVLDTEAPDIAYVIPSAGSNTMFSSQPVIAWIADEHDVSSVQFTVTDEATGTSITPAAELRQDGWAATVPLQLIPGHNYQIKVVATDRAGNSALVDQSQDPQGGFLVTSLEQPVLQAEADRTQCVVEPLEGGSSTRTVECKGLVVRLPSAPISHAGSRHHGQGSVRQTVDLSLAHLVHPTPTGELTQPAYPPGESVSYHRQFVLDPGGAGLAFLAEIYEELPPVVAEVPASWDQVYFDMSSQEVGGEYITCADPSSAAVRCGPDPVPSPELVWNPPVPKHSSLCSAALIHKPSLIIPEGEPQVLQATLAPGFIQADADGPQLLWRRHGTESYATATGVLDGETLSFDLTGLIESGDRIHYAIKVAGISTAQWCEDVEGLVSPSRFAYSTIVADTLDIADASVLQNVNTAIVIMASQPSVEDPSALTADEVCDLFSEVTPCDLFASYPNENPVDDGYELAVPANPSRARVAGNGGGEPVCIYGISDGKNFWDGTGSENRSESAPGLPGGLAYGRSDYVVEAIDGSNSVQQRSVAAAALYGQVKHDGYSKVGFVHGWEKTSPSAPDHVIVIATLRYRAVGDGFVDAGDVGHFTDIMTGPGPSAHAHPPGVAGGIYKLEYLTPATALGSYEGGWRPVTENWTARRGRKTPEVIPVLWSSPKRHWNSGYRTIVFKKFRMDMDVDYAFFARLRATVEAQAIGAGGAASAEEVFAGENEHGDGITYKHRIEAVQLTLQRADGGNWAEC